MEGDTENQSSQNPVIFSTGNYGDESAEYIFDRKDVRAIFLVLYTVVFCCCFFGNLMVILVVTLHWRMRSITNFCLANLAFADLCVGIFCVYQNIVTYLMDSWIFGEFMCKMYHFINSLSTTASVMILVVICIERYLAIIHPMTCKQMMTLNRLRITIVLVWILSAAISSPRFYYFGTISMPLPNNQYEILCLPNRTKYNSKLIDMISMTVLFLTPLAIITILYTHIGIVLWKSSNNRMSGTSPTQSVESSSSSDSYREKRDHNLVQTVNLTLRPLTSQQTLQQQDQTNRLKVAGHSSPSTVASSGGTHVKKLSSFLPSQLICGNKSKKHRKHAKKTPHHCKAAPKPPFEGTICENCSRNIQMDGNLVPGNSAGVIPNGGVGSVRQELIMNCKACQKPYMHQPHSPIQPLGVNCERVETTSFTKSCCQHYNQHNFIENEPSTAGNVGEPKYVRTRDEAISSPVGTTCCGVRARPTSTCLKRRGSRNKNSIPNMETPSSPFCDKNCSCSNGSNSKSEPIVLVKFEKKNQSNKQNRKSQSTILMNTKTFIGSSPVSCNKNHSKVEGQGESNPLEENMDGDSPETMLPSPPRFACGISQPQFIACSKEIRNVHGNDHIGGISLGNAISGGINHHHHQNSFSRNLPLGHKKTLSVDSGISATGRTNIDESSLEGVCGVSCPSCGVICMESANQLYRCPHHNRYVSASHPKLSHFASPNVPVSTPSVPKRVKRMRITRSNKYGSSALKSRRRIIKMLIVVVLAFALCHLPFHARKVWQYWSPKWASYQAGSVFSTLFTPLTFLIMYANSAINPLLYAFMSKKFRMSFKDLLCCKMRHSLRISRNASVRSRSTHAVQLSQAGL